MPQLYHFSLDPYCRRIRLVLGEYHRDAELIEERPWDDKAEFLQLNPAGLLPVFVDDDGTVAAGIEAVGEYLEDTLVDRSLSLLGENPEQRAEIRRLIAWFDGKFHHEVTAPILGEKLVRRFVSREAGGGSPNMNRVRLALKNIRPHLEYIGILTDDRNWLAGDELTLADFAAAAHLSTLDYLGDVPWRENERAKAWYQRIKSRRSFRPILADQIRNMPPPRIYADLDF